MKRFGRKLDVMTRLAVAAAGALLSAACGSSARSPEVSPAPSARPAALAAPAPPPAADAGPPALELPRAVSLDGFAESDRVADLAGLSVGDRMLLAWVTYFDEQSVVGIQKKKRASRGNARSPAAPADPGKQGASVVVRVLDKDGEALAQPKIVSSKAVSIGGVVLAQGSAPGNEIALGWVGKDAGVGQVFLTKLSETGDKQAQRMITHSKTGCSDVALAALADGFLVAWVESKEEGGQVFAAKVGRDFVRTGPERRIAQAKGEASDLRVLRRGDEVLLLWSEERTEGEGGIAAARLLASDLATRGDPSLVLPAPRHPKGLDLSRFGDGVEVLWVEDGVPGPADAGAASRSLVVGRLDASARSASARAVIPIGADPSSVVLDCDRVCRVVVPVSERGELAFYGFSYDGSLRAGVARRLASVSGVSTEDTSPVLVKDWLFFAEDNLHGGGRIRKAKLAW